MEHKHHNHNNGGGSGFFLGVLVGALITLLFTTKKGREVLKHAAEKGLNKFSDLEKALVETEEEFEDEAIDGNDYIKPEPPQADPTPPKPRPEPTKEVRHLAKEEKEEVKHETQAAKKTEENPSASSEQGSSTGSEQGPSVGKEEVKKETNVKKEKSGLRRFFKKS